MKTYLFSYTWQNAVWGYRSDHGCPATSRRTCLNSPDSFCYICGSLTISSQRTNISKFVKQAYSAYFKIKLGGQGNKWAFHHKVCKKCVESLRKWTKGTSDKLPLCIPMVWQKQKRSLHRLLLLFSENFRLKQEK